MKFNTPRRSHLHRVGSQNQFPVRTACAARLRSLLLLLLLTLPSVVQARFNYTNWTTATNIQDAVDAAVAATNSAATATAKTSIPWSQIGAKAGGDYQGDGLAVMPAAEGARLRCVFQRLEGEATTEGLWLTSTVTNGVNDHFRVVAADVRRLTSTGNLKPETQNEVESLLASAATDRGTLPRTGTVQFADKLVRFTRPGVIEEYSVSMDGVRQDFIIEHPLLNPQLSTLNRRAGELAVRLAVSGARVEPAVGGAQLVLENSGRRIAYSRLRVTDATGKQLRARMEVTRRAAPAAPVNASLTGGTFERGACALMLLVNDADAVYPVRIDPTFSDANWISMNPGMPGVDGGVRAAVVDGAGNLYIGGSFTIVGDVLANGIAKWNGCSWSALGSGMSSPPANDASVYALAVSGSDLYAGGAFHTAGGNAAGRVAKWNGSSWSALGSGINNGTVSALAMLGSDLYAGGYFFEAPGTAASYISKWNGSSWTKLGSGVSGGVMALVVSGTNLYVGGDFLSAGGAAIYRIAKWDGSGWSSLGSGIWGFNRVVYALAVSGSDVYAGGDFTIVDGNPATNIAKWSGSSWTNLGSGIGGAPGYATVSVLAASGSDVYAGGDFTTAGGNAATNIAKWDGISWSALDSGVGGSYPRVWALAGSGSNVYVGGQFSTAGGSAANSIAKWNGSSWSAVGSHMGMNGSVLALAVSGSDVYAGGGFTTAGGTAANYIAKWNGRSWRALGSGIGGIVAQVNALAVSGGDVYAGGQFTTAGGTTANNIAKWNGNSWSEMGVGIDGWVVALAVSGSNVYAGGYFSTAGGSSATNIAKWNGSSWTNLASGISAPLGYPYYGGNVSALVASGSDLYAGGEFTTAGGSAANYVAKWDGNTWSALGLGLGGPPGDVFVSALAVSGRDIYAGGYFTTAGGSAAYSVAKWNGISWTNLDSGISDNYPYVYALAVSGSDLYAGGGFGTAGEISANSIAKWNGSNWSALGSGMNNYVSALAVSGSDLYAGGQFAKAGGKFSAYLARAIVNPPILAIEGDGDAGYFISFIAVPGSAYRLQRAPGVSGPWTASPPQTAPVSGHLEFWDLFPPPGQSFYRTVQP